MKQPYHTIKVRKPAGRKLKSHATNLGFISMMSFFDALSEADIKRLKFLNRLK